ncbi:nucleotide disphospho-sugar-binding domain-containing protein [Croceibacterium aestuarii]|uniref:nucleotide disphospho-sugar-binding domain-containing protein n=1 Tax=Croceibacterium aestuarii TaxID=3064139 RepID=UPI00272E30FC|nr:nucleotide disphospho-sugar-binding domain-containing protein [Croceibacterium sp. D39]
MLDPHPRRKFLVTTWEGGGSVGPALTVARKLIDAGHDVRVMSDACNRPESERTGARFVPWTRAPSRTDRHRDSEIVRDWAGATPAEGLGQVLRDVTAGRAVDYAEDLLAELRREPADLVVGSELLLGVELGCEVAGQPCAVLACNSIMFPITGAPPAGPALTADQQAAMAPLFEQMMRAFAEATQVFNVARAHYGLRPLGNMWDQVLVARKTLLGVSRTFDFAPADTGDHFTYVGPQLDEATWTEQWQSPWPEDDARPLVLVGFSTTFQNHVGVLQWVIDALASFPVRVLVTLGPTIAAEELSPAANTALVPSAPHGAVMREAALVVTHGGHGTVARALLHRLPLLVIPHGRDQNGNAMRIAAHGAGMMLPPSAGTGEIAAAIGALLGDPAFAAGARALGEAVERETRESDVVEQLEALCYPVFA